MRQDITESSYWRAAEPTSISRRQSWATQRRSQESPELAADVVDAALAEVAAEEPECTKDEQPTLASFLENLNTQMELLEQQRERLQGLLDQAD